jgi:hypothetical protein
MQDEPLGCAIRAEYEGVCAVQAAARVAKIRANVGTGPVHPPSPGAARALRRIVPRPGRPGRPAASRAEPARVLKMAVCNPPPTGLSWVRVRTNLRTPEGCISGYFVPYLGDTDAHLKSSTSLARDLQLSKEDEDDDSDGDVELDLSDVEFLHPYDESRAGVRLWVRAWERAAKRVTIKSVVDSGTGSVSSLAAEIGLELNVSEENVKAYYTNAVHRARAWEKHDAEKRFKEQCKMELAAVAQARMSDPPQVELESDSLTMLLCRQCYSFDCMQHGLDTSRPDNSSPDGTRTDVMSEAERGAVTDRCRSISPGGCWFQPGGQAAAGARPLAPTARVLHGSLREQFGDDFCRISEMLRIVDPSNSSALQCKDVGAFAATLPPVAAPKRPRQQPKKSRGGGAVPSKEIYAMSSGRRLDFTPCNHTGPCTVKSCSCAQEGVNCEKYCTCNHVRVAGEDRTHALGVCPRAFRGCNCKSAAACQTNHCVCVSHRRECDPDLCRSCGAANAPGEPRGCCNAGLRLGSRYRTVVGQSGVHGWGVFAAVEIPRNALIGEYLGEVITQEEAERRGRVYDELDYSFLFNITRKYAIDSTRLGSKLKYCNHSQEPNCEPRLMRVGGDVRVGIYSKQAISLFEELFFDYGYGKTGPDWAKKKGGKAKDQEGAAAEAAAASGRSRARSAGGSEEACSDSDGEVDDDNDVEDEDEAEEDDGGDDGDDDDGDDDDDGGYAESYRPRGGHKPLPRRLPLTRERPPLKPPLRPLLRHPLRPPLRPSLKPQPGSVVGFGSVACEAGTDSEGRDADL